MSDTYREIQTYLHEAELPYTGPELRPHFLLSRFKVEGSTLAAFIGPCDVKTDHLVDWEDRLANDSIRAKSMVHFLGEFFGITLREGVWIQRLIVSELAQCLQNLPGVGPGAVYRDGDDLFWTGGASGRSKLSVSIVTASPVSVLLHLGVNIDAAGAPVQAAGLKDLGLHSPDSVRSLVKDLLAWFETEYRSVARACVKVRPVV
jgi:hypothetical protein